MKQVNFKDKSVWKSLEKQAYEGTVDFRSFPANEYKYFAELVRYYAEFRFGAVDMELAKANKDKLYAEYISNTEQSEHCLEVYRAYQENLCTLNTRLSDIEKAQSADEIALLACECIELLTGEFEFSKRQRRKIFKEE